MIGNKTSLGNRAPLVLQARSDGNVFVFAEARARGTPGG